MTVDKCKKAGASLEKTTILMELDIVGKFLGSQLTSQVACPRLTKYIKYMIYILFFILSVVIF